MFVLSRVSVLSNCGTIADRRAGHLRSFGVMFQMAGSSLHSPALPAHLISISEWSKLEIQGNMRRF